jgi:anti-anti-sigma factor
MPAKFTLDQHPDAWVLTAQGEIDYADSPAFRSCVECLLAGSPPAAIIDLSKIRFLDSSGLGLLLRLHREYDADSRRMVLIPSKPVSGVLDLTRLADRFVTAPDLETARAALVT